MSRLVVPFSHRVVYATGDLCLWVSLLVDLKNNAGNFAPEGFRVDTGAEITTYPAFEAKGLNLPMPVAASAGVAHTQTGLEIRSGYLRFRIIGMDLTEYAVPCLFLGDPTTPPSGPAATFPRKLLQPLGLVNWLRFTFDRDPSSGTPYGEMIVEKK